MADRSVVVKLRAEVGAYIAAMQKAKAETQSFAKELSGQGKTAKADLETIGRGAAVMATGMVVGFGLAAKAAMDWESAWAGVTKTVNGSVAQMADLEGGLRDLAKELPATHAEIAGVAEAAGALGIQRSAIESFTRTMIDLGETTNVTADQAATAFAQIGNIMGTSQDDFDRMGSTLVDLGNNGASTEAEILELANRLAAAGKIAGLSESDLFGFASSLASVGVEAEAGGTALSKVFTTVSDAVIDGSEKLDTFARVAGVTSEQFAASFRDDPAMAINDFVLGLGRMIDAGESTSGVFQELELTDSRLMNALRSTAGAGELLAQSIEMGRAAWEANNALQSEAEKRYETTAAKIEIARNNLVDMGINIGGVLLPALAQAAEGTSALAQGFSEMPGPLKGVSIGIGGAVTAGLGMAAAATLLVPKIKAARDALIAMGAAGKVAAASMPWLAVAAAAMGAVAFAFGEQAKEAEAAEENVKGFADAIREAGRNTQGVENHLISLAEETPALTEVLDAAGVGITELADAAMGSDRTWDAFVGKLRDSADGAGLSRDALGLLHTGLGGVREGAREGADEAARLARVVEDTGSAAATSAPQVGGLASELGMSADEAERARDEFEDLMDAYRASVDPLFGVLDALEANREAQGAEAKARADGAKHRADAAADVAEAEKDLRDARGKKDNAEGIAAAEERLVEARERLAEVSADAAITAEEKAAFDRAAAESALDLEVAARTLAEQIALQPGLLDEAKGMLQEWMTQGSLTKEQAYLMGVQFDEAAGKAKAIGGDVVTNFYFNSADAEANIDRTAGKIKTLASFLGGLLTGTGEVWGGNPPVEGNWEGVIGKVFGVDVQERAAGGPFGPGWLLAGEEGPELIRVGSPGHVFNAQDTTRMAGSMFTGGSGDLSGLSAPSMGGSTSYDHSRRVEFNLSPTIVESRSPRATAADVMFEAKVMAAGMS